MIARQSLAVARAPGLVLGAIACGALTAVYPAGALVLLGLLGLGVLAMSGLARISFVVLVGILVLGPPELTPGKIAYFAGVLVSLVAAGSRVVRAWPTLPNDVRRAVRVASIGWILFGLVALVRIMSGGDPVTALRDLTPYVLVAAGPIFAIDAALSVPLGRLQVAAGVLLGSGSLGYLISWMGRRGIVAADPTQAADTFGGYFMPIALIVLAAICLRDGLPRHRPLWIGAAGIAAASMALTGTRSFLLILPALLVTLFIGDQLGRRRPMRAFLGLATLVVAGIAAFLVGSALAGADVAAIADRWHLVFSAIANPTSDDSLASRLYQTEALWAIFTQYPAFGYPGGLAQVSLVLGTYLGDTPVAVLAAFGVAGVAALATLFLAWATITFRRADPRGPAWPRSTMIGLLVAAATYSLLGPVAQDKGLGFSFMLVGAPLVAIRLAASSAGAAASPGGAAASPGGAPPPATATRA